MNKDRSTIQNSAQDVFGFPVVLTLAWNLTPGEVFMYVLKVYFSILNTKSVILYYCSSIGMAKSALEAINGCNLFGEKGASWSVIYVDIDAHNRNRSIFETMLPRESSSKVQ